MITADKKAKAIKAAQRGKSDTGSPEVQISILTERIKELTAHMKQHKQDMHNRRGLVQMVGRRKKLLQYLKETDYKSYKSLVEKLGLRK